MGELSIKIKIANRVYPLTVDSSEEEGIWGWVTANYLNEEIQKAVKAGSPYLVLQYFSSFLIYIHFCLRCF